MSDKKKSLSLPGTDIVWEKDQMTIRTDRLPPGEYRVMVVSATPYMALDEADQLTQKRAKQLMKLLNKCQAEGIEVDLDTNEYDIHTLRWGGKTPTSGDDVEYSSTATVRRRRGPGWTGEDGPYEVDMNGEVV